MQLSTTTYKVPTGRIGKRYLKCLTLLWQGVRERKWNSERPLMFAKLILQTTRNVKKSKDVRARLELRMDLWERGQQRDLLNDVIAEVGRHPPVHNVKDNAANARSFQACAVSGRLRKAVRGVTNRGGGGVLQPDDVCTKTGWPILEVLQGKHPKMRESDLDDPRLKIFEAYPTLPQVVRLDITADAVEKVASRLSGSVGPSGTDAVDLGNWLLRHSAESQLLRTEMANMARWIANEHSPWAAYRALMACRLVALDKEPGTRPVGIGEIYCRLMAKCVLEACSNLNLCAEPPLPVTQDFMTNEAVPAVNMADTTHVTLLVDARNGFNELGRKTMLWDRMGRRSPLRVQLLPPCVTVNFAQSGRPMLRPLIGRRHDPRGPSFDGPLWSCPGPSREEDSRQIRDTIPGAMQAW